jgi:2-phosphosulfolactate phosphatase
MRSTVVVDFLPESALRYREGFAVVAVDVIRATTSAVTAAASGRRCFPAPTLEAALNLAAVLDGPLLAGELGGHMPFGFDLTNSPAEIAALGDRSRDLVLLSSSGTQLIHNAVGCDAVYVACLRNVRATVHHLHASHRRVAVLGAGSRGEFREEDQACCAAIASGLIARGFAPENALTEQLVARWAGTGTEAWLASKSVDYLRRTEQLADLRFILDHVDDLSAAYVLEDGQVVARPLPERSASSRVSVSA